MHRLDNVPTALLLAPDFNEANPHYGRFGEGTRTWPGDQWKVGGGTTWGYWSYDPELNLFYYGTGNPGTWNPTPRKGDNKWSMSIWARDPDTGRAKWAYQMTPWDAWDFDGVNEGILADLTIGGKKVKAIVHFDRNGFGYTLDRTNGTLLVAEPFVTVNWATGVDKRTGRPIEDPSKRTQADDAGGLRQDLEGRRDLEDRRLHPIDLSRRPGRDRLGAAASGRARRGRGRRALDHRRGPRRPPPSLPQKQGCAGKAGARSGGYSDDSY